MNHVVGHAIIIPDVDIMHHGFTNEVVRRKRFVRNISLTAKDRDDTPDRSIGRFVWLLAIVPMSSYKLV